MIKEIVQVPHPALREVCTEVPASDITSDEITSLISDMKDSLNSQDDGIGISAPQIAVTKRIFIVSHKLFESDPNAKDLVFINPEITWTSKKTDIQEEGCLSIRGKIGDVERPIEVKVESYNEVGERLEYEAKGFLARIIQHEIDHLNGILFTDKSDNVRDVPYEG